MSCFRFFNYILTAKAIFLCALLVLLFLKVKLCLTGLPQMKFWKLFDVVVCLDFFLKPELLILGIITKYIFIYLFPNLRRKILAVFLNV